jgi:hypothetical protein
VPGTGGSYITVCRDGRVKLRSLDGDLVDSVPEVDDASPPSNVRVVPVSANSVDVIIVHATTKCVAPIIFDEVPYTDFYFIIRFFKWDAPGCVRVMNVSQSCLKLLTTVPTTTRAFSGDVTADRFTFLANGFDRLDHLELHIYPLPGCTSSLPETGIVLHLKGLGRDVSRCYVPCRHKLKILRQSRGSTIAFLDERHIIVGNKIGLATYDLCLDSLSDPIRLPYWTDFRPLSSTVYNSSHLTISVIYPALPNGVVQCIIYTGSYFY